MANVSSVNTFLPSNDWQVEQKAIERRRRLAETLQQQSMAPLETNQMAGGYVIPTSPFAALAKLLQGYTAGKMQDESDTKEKDIASKAQQQRASEFAAALQARDGTPATSETIMDEQANGGEGQIAQINAPGIAGSKSAMYARLLRSPDPSLQQMGMAGMMKEDDEKYGHSPQTELIDGKPHSVLYGDRGTRKVVGPVTPRDKMETVGLGGTTGVFNPYAINPGTVLPHTQTPDNQATLGQRQYEWQNPSAHQRVQEQQGWGNLGVAQGNLGVAQDQLGVARGNLGINAQNSYFNTGMMPGQMPGMGGGGAMGGQAPQMPQQAPQQPQSQYQMGPRGNQPAPQMPMQGPMPNQNAPQLPPSMQGGTALTPKQRAELEMNRPQETQKLQSIGIQIDNAIKQADTLLTGRGVAGVTGPIMGRLPSIMGSSTNAQANIDTLKAQIGVQVLNAMREASKTGGAVGNVTEKEWPILQNQLGALQQSQTTPEFLKNLKDVRDSLARVKMNAQQSYASIYGPMQQQGAGASGKWGGSVMDQADAILRGSNGNR